MKKKILIVDDHEDIREFLEIVLCMENYEVFTAEDGAKAWSFLASNMVDLIITDYSMPNMNGAELIKLVRPKYPKLPIILSSTLRPLDCGLEKEIIYSIAKPYGLNELESLVRVVLGSKL